MIDPQRLLIGQAATANRRGQPRHYRNLFDAEIQVFSQWGEDGILDFLCDELGIAKPRILELGCGNLLESNSRFLLESRCASAVVVDAREDLIGTVTDLPLAWRTTIIPVQSWITPESVVGLQAMAHDQLGGVDVISLAIDGNDFWVASALDWTSVRLVVVEYNPILGPWQPVAIPRDDDFNRGHAHYSGLYFGASLGAWIHFFTAQGLSIVGTNRAGNNAFFVRVAERDRISVDDFGAEAMAVAVDWRVREARGLGGALALRGWADYASELASLPLVNTATGETTTLGAAAISADG